MAHKFIALGFIPLVALYLGWSIQPVGREFDPAAASREVWPDYARTEFRTTLEDARFAVDTNANHFVANQSWHH